MNKAAAQDNTPVYYLDDYILASEQFEGVFSKRDVEWYILDRIGDETDVVFEEDIPGFNMTPEPLKYNPVIWAQNKKGRYLLNPADPFFIYTFHIERVKPRFKRSPSGRYKLYRDGSWSVKLYRFKYDEVKHVYQHARHFDIDLNYIKG